MNLVVQQNVASLDAARATANAQERLGSEADGAANGGLDQTAQSDGTGTQSPRAPLSDEENRRLDQGATLIQSIKSHVERTAQAVRDGRRRRKYNNLPRHDFRVLVFALVEDGAIANEEASQLNHAFSLWRRFQRRRTPVPDFVLTELRSVEKQFAQGNQRT
ncbi:MAG: hypothetical protein ABL864_15655 [Terricaulis sp.]